MSPTTTDNDPRWQKIRFLYVGSDEDLILSLRQLYPRPKYQVVACPDRSGAEMFIKSDIQYHLLVFDHEMRDRAAFDLTRLVRSLAHREHLPVMVVGAEVNNSLSEFTETSGGNAYVRKAKDFSAVHRMLSRLLGESINGSRGSESGTVSRRDAGS